MAFFDAAVTSFLFCGLPDPLQVPALRGLGRVVKPGGLVRLLEFVRPRGSLRRVVSSLWQSWIGWRMEQERHVPAAGPELLESLFLVDDLFLTARLRG